MLKTIGLAALAVSSLLAGPARSQVAAGCAPSGNEIVTTTTATRVLPPYTEPYTKQCPDGSSVSASMTVYTTVLDVFYTRIQQLKTPTGASCGTLRSYWTETYTLSETRVFSGGICPTGSCCVLVSSTTTYTPVFVRTETLEPVVKPITCDDGSDGTETTTVTRDIWRMDSVQVLDYEPYGNCSQGETCDDDTITTTGEEYVGNSTTTVTDDCP